MVFPKRGCFKCGNVGHFADVCPEPERLCYNCKQPGHESGACPRPKSADAKQCFACGGVGHIQADCPTPRTQDSSTTVRCFNCKRVGHIAQQCNNAPSVRPRRGGFAGRGEFRRGRGRGRGNGSVRGGFTHGRVVCYNCGGYNHFARDCQANVVKCYNCGKFGHIARECTAESRAPSERVKTCYQCREPGHIVRDCPKNQVVDEAVKAVGSVSSVSIGSDAEN